MQRKRDARLKFLNEMKRLKRCLKCGAYTLRESCQKCGIKTEPAGYKFIQKYSQ